MMRGLSGTENPQGRMAIDWLADAIFNPALMADAPILKVDTALLYAQAGLESDEKERRQYYSLSEIRELLQITAPRAVS